MRGARYDIFTYIDTDLACLPLNEKSDSQLYRLLTSSAFCCTRHQDVLCSEEFGFSLILPRPRYLLLRYCAKRRRRTQASKILILHHRYSVAGTCACFKPLRKSSLKTAPEMRQSICELIKTSKTFLKLWYYHQPQDLRSTGTNWHKSSFLSHMMYIF